MPIPTIYYVLENGWPSWAPDPLRIVKFGSALGALIVTKRWFGGAKNLSDRNMHGRVVLLTGGLSGIGAAVARELAQRGAQVVLLTHHEPSDPFLADYVDDLRTRTNNEMIYAEQVDLSSLWSIRQFATRWIDNAPPRRLDMIVLCAATMTPPGQPRSETAEGVEKTWMVNYLANFHLLGILSPAIRAQPFDRDVRIVFATCPRYISSPPLADDDVAGRAALDAKGWSASAAYARSKLALMTFGQAFQKHLDVYKRPDELPMNARVVFVDPGWSRTAGMRRWLTRGSLWGLVVYMVFYFFAWLFLKSPEMGAQSVLFAALDSSIERDNGGKLIKECMEVDYARKDVKDEEVAKKLWESSDKLIEKLEKESAKRRAREKKEKEKKDEDAKAAEKIKEIEALVNTIRKGKQQETETQTTAKTKSRRSQKQGGKAIP